MPSFTLNFHPAIILIKNIINSNRLGNISNITYHSGQYLPDWHIFEHVKDFYVSKKEVGGCREIVPFELLWITKIFGFPIKIHSTVKKTINIEGAEQIDDVYMITFNYDKFIINILIDVVSRSAIRQLLINGDNGQLKWNWNKNFVKIYNTDTKEWIKKNYDVLPANDNYNKNITEEMYINEIKYFIDCINSRLLDKNSLDYDNTILKLLYQIEKASIIEKTIPFYKFGILINIRLGSSRLKQKHLVKFGSKMAIEWLIIRLKYITKLWLDHVGIKIIIASTPLDINKPLIDIAKDNDINIYFGADQNIPLRHLECAEHFGLTHVMPLDGDDIFVSEITVISLINYFINNPDVNIINTNNYPLGLNTICYNINYLRKIMNTNNNRNKILTTGWHSIFNDDIHNVDIYNKLINNKLRFTLDYEEDKLFFEEIIKRLGNNFTTIRTHDMINFVTSNKLYKINKHLHDIYWSNFNTIRDKESEKN